MEAGRSLQSAVVSGHAPSLLHTEEGLAWHRLFLSKAKLKEARGTSFILAAFSMSMMTELSLEMDTTIPTWLFATYAVNTVLLITVHIFSLVISTCLLPTMEAVCEEYDVTKAVPEYSPHNRMRNLVVISVTLSSVLGLVLFLLEVALLAWVKFWDHARSACWAGSMVMAPALVSFILFCWYFRKTLNEHVYHSRLAEISEMQTHVEEVVSMSPNVVISEL